MQREHGSQYKRELLRKRLLKAGVVKEKEPMWEEFSDWLDCSLSTMAAREKGFEIELLIHPPVRCTY